MILNCIDIDPRATPTQTSIVVVVVFVVVVSLRMSSMSQIDLFEMMKCTPI